jgi:hypothetical protein
MSSSIRFEVDSSVTTLLTTQLDSLASAAKTTVSSAYDNRTNLFFWADFEGVLASAITPAGSQTWEIYAIPTIDGTNYADGGSSVVPSTDCLLGTLKFQAVTGQQRVVALRLPIPPHSFKVMVKNNLGGTLASSGNTVKMLPYGEKVG